MPEPMLKVGAAEAERNFGLYQDKALQQPVEVIREGKPPVVMISVAEYQRLKWRDRDALAMEELTDEEVAAIAAAEPPAEAAAYDHEVR
jgi:PHD/YefM family antitoxin component YafN of YafNO toxin-antitoxin module